MKGKVSVDWAKKKENRRSMSSHIKLFDVGQARGFSSESDGQNPFRAEAGK